MSIKAWTDYPFGILGDEPHKEAPIRECEIMKYDGNKYVRIRIGAMRFEIKVGYCYAAPGRCGEVDGVSMAAVRNLPRF